MEKPPKVTQREIARIAGVSQATVSMVLNDREYSNVRIPEATRERVRRAIEQTTYVPDPAARRLAGLDNKILGVFTYEAALSRESLDFYGPLLHGIEQEAERLGCDLLFFTSSPVEDGTRKLFHKQTRLRLTDGCILLGQQMDSAELTRLVEEGFPFVAVGRRDEPGVPYVGIDYVTLTGDIVEQAVALGHRRITYAHYGRSTPAAADRVAGLALAAETMLVETTLLSTADSDLSEVAAVIANGTDTVVITEDVFMAEALAVELAEHGKAIPEDLSLAVLGDVEGHSLGGRGMTGFQLPREQLAAEALALLQQLIVRNDKARAKLELRTMIEGSIVAGATLAQLKESR
ncbi:LacI family DNA-binding transcriptional regulator [Kribbella koreensis]|uniref:LacI family DNA-binding transcriptional regulator n=1 Tax=Kribbella koreensis TaxID=57909 RepID=A0ABN1PV07_9ACTN